MPDRQYVSSDGKFPRWVDRAFSHIYEVTLSIIAMIVGVLAITAASDGVTGPHRIASTLGLLMPAWAFALGFSLLVGGIISMVATLKTFQDRMTYWTTIRTGVWLECIGWTIYGFAALIIEPQDIVALTVMFGLAIALAIRFIRTVVDEHRLRAAKMLGRLSDKP